jgi:hypothetical protein
VADVSSARDRAIEAARRAGDQAWDESPTRPGGSRAAAVAAVNAALDAITSPEVLRALAGEAGTPVRPGDDREKRFQHLASMAKDWDSYGAEPINPAAVQRARRILAWLDDEPRIYATAEGGIQLAWAHEEVDITVAPDGTLTASIGDSELSELPSDAVRLVPAAGRDREPAPVYPQEWCDDMTGPNGAGGPCVLGPGHHHRDGIGGEWAWGASVVPAAAPEPDEGGPVSYEPVTPEAEQLAELIAPVMGAWTLGSPLHDRAPRQVAEAVIRAGWSVPAAAPTRAGDASRDLFEVAGKAAWVVRLWRDWPQDRRDKVRALSGHLADALEDLRAVLARRTEEQP